MKSAVVVLSLCLGLVACSSGSTGGTGGGSAATGGGAGGGTAGGAGGGTAGGSGGGSGGATITVAECGAEMDKFVSANCSDKNDYATAKTVICPKITNASSSLCNAALTRAKTCHAQFLAATVACNGLGVTDTTDPCGIDVLLATYCVGAVNTIGCASTLCQSSTDCGTNSSCNNKTGKCYLYTSNCIGLPCTSSTDCPTGETCNTALSQCVKQ